MSCHVIIFIVLYRYNEKKYENLLLMSLHQFGGFSISEIFFQIIKGEEAWGPFAPTCIIFLLKKYVEKIILFSKMDILKTGRPSHDDLQL